MMLLSRNVLPGVHSLLVWLRRWAVFILWDDNEVQYLPLDSVHIHSLIYVSICKPLMQVNKRIFPQKKEFNDLFMSDDILSDSHSATTRNKVNLLTKKFDLFYYTINILCNILKSVLLLSHALCAWHTGSGKNTLSMVKRNSWLIEVTLHTPPNSLRCSLMAYLGHFCEGLNHP